jgi:hypothetical protein
VITQALERMIDDSMDQVVANVGVESINREEQAALHAMRAEASILGEGLGLSNMQVGASLLQQRAQQ